MVIELAMRHAAILLSLVLSIALSVHARATEPGVTVAIGIFSGRQISACSIESQSAMRLETPCGPARDLPVGVSMVLKVEDNQVRVARSDVESAEPCQQCTVTSASPLKITPAGGKARTYRGTLEVTLEGRALELVNRVGLEDYLRGVVPAEMPAEFHPEALKAQVIAARTYALANVAKHQRDGFNLCDGVHCQVYAGVGCEDRRVDAAVRETAGLILTYQGQPISAVYCDTCGGETATPAEAWGGTRPIPYLRSVDDTYAVAAVCRASPKARWTRTVTQEKLAAALAKWGVTASLILIRPTGCEDGTRPDRYRLIGPEREWAVPAGEMRTALNRGVAADTLPSADFIALIDGDTITFTGWGNGHGVGLCQWGANGWAKLGKTAAEILAHYYPGATLEPMS